jgi:hypothetical protein
MAIIILGIPSITIERKKLSKENALNFNNPTRTAIVANNNPEIKTNFNTGP